jgi:DNA-binding CsgD family transcriptional regulator
MYTEASVLSLVELIYGAACDPDRWPQLLESLCSMVGASGADVAAFDLNRPVAQIHAAVGVISADAFKREYLDYYITVDPFVAAGRRLNWFVTGNIGLGDWAVPPHELVKSEFYCDFGRRHDFLGGLTAVIKGKKAAGSALSLTRRRTAEFGNEEIVLMRALLPHLQRALQVHNRLTEAQTRESVVVSLLDRITTGAILADGAGRVLLANQRAREILRERDGLTCDRGVLRAARARESTELLKLIGGAAQTSVGTALSPGGIVVLGRPSGKRAFQVTVSPMPLLDEAGVANRPLAVMFIVDPERAFEPHVELIRRVYGLSRAEGEVARLLVDGRTLQEIADLLCVSINTVRFHVKQLFSKTDTTRQSELLRVLLSSLPIRSTHNGAAGPL